MIHKYKIKIKYKKWKMEKDQIILNLIISYIDQLRLRYKITQIYNVSIIEIIDY